MHIKKVQISDDMEVRANIVRKEPEAHWRVAHEKGLIPSSLYALYTKSSYLSFGKAPKYLDDPDHILIGYFGMLLRSLCDFFVEFEDLQNEYETWQAKIYDPIKKAKGESWDPEAPKHTRRAFKYFLIAILGSLDAFAELVAIFFSTEIKDLAPGNADFYAIEQWLRKSLPVKIIATPQDHYLEMLHKSLAPLLLTTGSSENWLQLARIYRNKSTHMGDSMFRISFHDKAGKFYTFLPRKWPYIYESDIQPSLATRKRPRGIRSHLEKLLIHQDVVSYIKDLRQVTFRVLSEGLTVLSEVYSKFDSFAVNNEALKQIKKSSKTFTFKHF